METLDTTNMSNDEVIAALFPERPVVPLHMEVTEDNVEKCQEALQAMRDAYYSGSPFVTDANYDDLKAQLNTFVASQPAVEEPTSEASELPAQ